MGENFHHLFPGARRGEGGGCAGHRDRGGAPVQYLPEHFANASGHRAVGQPAVNGGSHGGLPQDFQPHLPGFVQHGPADAAEKPERVPDGFEQHGCGGNPRRGGYDLHRSERPETGQRPVRPLYGRPVYRERRPGDPGRGGQTGRSLPDGRGRVRDPV